MKGNHKLDHLNNLAVFAFQSTSTSVLNEIMSQMVFRFGQMSKAAIQVWDFNINKRLSTHSSKISLSYVVYYSCIALYSKAQFTSGIKIHLSCSDHPAKTTCLHLTGTCISNASGMCLLWPLVSRFCALLIFMTLNVAIQQMFKNKIKVITP